MSASKNSTTDAFWAARRVLVTGATGLVGSWLVKELLALRASVVALVLDADPQSELIRSGDLRATTVVNGDLTEFATLDRAINVQEVDTVIHLGAQTIVGAAQRFPLTTFEANIRGTYNLLEVCRLQRDRVRRIVVASSDKAYGEHADLPYREEMPLLAKHPYEVSKSCVDMLAQCYSASYELPVAVARFGNVFGGGDLNWSRIVPGTIRSLLAGERPIIRSDGQFRRDYIYVRDVARTYTRLAERLDEAPVRGQAFNFSMEQPLTVLEMVAAIRKLMGREDIEPDIRNTAHHEIRDQYLDASKVRRRLGWSCAFDLETGLRETIDWYVKLLGSGR